MWESLCHSHVIELVPLVSDDTFNYIAFAVLYFLSWFDKTVVMTRVYWPMVNQNCMKSIEIFKSLLFLLRSVWIANRAVSARILWESKAVCWLKYLIKIKSLLELAYWIDFFEFSVSTDSKTVNVYLKYWRQLLDSKKLLCIL